MSAVTVVGGGFSGLVSAYYLAINGIPVRLLERDDRLGGLIGTVRTPHGPMELAANGIRSSARLEALCADLGVTLQPARRESRARYLYRDGRPRRWPLGAGESIGTATRVATAAVSRGLSPRPEETIEEWGTRVLGRHAARFVLGTALQGIYAGDPATLSANLILGRRRRPEKGATKGMVAPVHGMGELIDALENRLRDLGVEIRTGAAADPDLEGSVIIATAASDAAELLRRRAPAAAEGARRIEMLPLARVNAFYPAEENTIGGFGILFPRGEGVRALGVLFNTNIFDHRGTTHSESWIYGGALDREVVALDDLQMQELVRRDRELVYGRDAEPLAMIPRRWPAALPNYDRRLEQILQAGLPTPPEVQLTGNYLGGIGLAMLIERAWEAANAARHTL